jgi:hypothetical protein
VKVREEENNQEKIRKKDDRKNPSGRIFLPVYRIVQSSGYILFSSFL